MIFVISIYVINWRRTRIYIKAFRTSPTFFDFASLNRGNSEKLVHLPTLLTRHNFFWGTQVCVILSSFVTLLANQSSMTSSSMTSKMCFNMTDYILFFEHRKKNSLHSNERVGQRIFSGLPTRHLKIMLQQITSAGEFLNTSIAKIEEIH